MHGTHARLISPAIATVLLHGAELNLLPALLRQVAWPAPSAKLLLVFEAEGHWATLYLEPHEGAYAALYLDGIQDRLCAQAHLLAHALGMLFGRTVLTGQQHNWFSHLRPSSCGVAALAHALAILNGSFRVEADDVSRVHKATLLTLGLPSRVVAYSALSPDQLKALCAILTEHGVPEDVVQERASPAVSG